MQKLTKQTLRIYWRHSMKYPWHVFFVLCGVVVITAIDAYKPFLYKNLFNNLAEKNTSHEQILIHIALQILGISVIHWILWRAITLVNNFFQLRVMSDLLNTCYEYLQGHSYNFFNNSFVGSIVTKVRRYERSFENIADQVCFNMGRIFLVMVSILIVLFVRYWLLGLIVAVWSVLFIVFAYFFSQFKLPYDIKKAAQDTKTTGHLADTLTNNLNIKLFTSKDREAATFKEQTSLLFTLRKITWDLGTISETLQGGSMVLLEFVMVYVSIKFWERGRLTIGDFVLIQSYLIQMFDKLWDLGRYIRMLYESIADANEMTEILERPYDIQDVPESKELVTGSGKIEFKNVGFSYYDNSSIFENFNLIIHPGERVAFVGPSGGGKTTIVKTLLRFFDIQKGTIFVDGQDISKVTQNSLRQNMSLVPQEPILFHRSLLENIRYAKPHATNAEVIEASKLAHCHEFIAGFPESYNTLVGERGVKLSGGERQRVAIARALLKNAPILILDEATSNLDSESEKFIQDALKNLMKGKTTIVIAHRLSTIMQMDRIIVLEKGKITEQGKHDELVKAEQGTYQKLWEIQAGGFA